MTENDETPWKYWDENNINGKDKKTWARMRCRNIGRDGKKGEEDWTCRTCKCEKETLVNT